MSLKKLHQAFLIRQALEDQVDRRLVPQEVHDAAHRCLTKLLKDAIQLNDAQKIESGLRDSIEEDIINDFVTVREYIQYLLLRLESEGITLEGKDDSIE